MKELEVSVYENKITAMWKNESQLKTIKDIYAKHATQDEFEIFIQMGIASGLNPFLREIWLVKYDKTAAAQIFIARDGYRKIISRNPNYAGHRVDAVYSNDEFNVDIIGGIVNHVPNFKDRGRLIGAFCMVYMKNLRVPHYVFVELGEYNTGRSVWKDKPATMIKKVAEAQAIRMADMTCSGTYSPEEMPEEKSSDIKSTSLNKDLGIYEGEMVDQVTGEVMDNKPEQNTVVDVQIPPNDAPVFTFDEIKSKMETAVTSEILHEAVSVISAMDITKDQRDELSKIYREKIKEIKKLEA